MEPGCSLDHFVVAVPNLNDTIEYWKENYGIEPVIGGRHTATGTWNALLSLYSSIYLEFLAIDESNTEFASLGKPYSFGVTQEKCLIPQIVTWAARTSTLRNPPLFNLILKHLKLNFSTKGDIQKDVQDESEASNLEPLPIRAGSRTRPDGSRLEWKITLPRGSKEQGDGYGVVPFLIDWLSTKSEIHPAATSPAGCRLRSFRIITPRVQKVQTSLKNVKIDASFVEEGEIEEVQIEIETPSGKIATLGHWKHALELRKALPSDGARVNAIYEKIKFFPANADKDEIVIAEVWGKLVGVGRIADTSDEKCKEMAGIWVDPAYRSRGIARMIVSRLAESVERLNQENVRVYCVPFAKLNGFYRQFGFEEHDPQAADVPESLKSKFSVCATRFCETPCSLLKYKP